MTDLQKVVRAENSKGISDEGTGYGDDSSCDDVIHKKVVLDYTCPFTIGDLQVISLGNSWASLYLTIFLRCIQIYIAAKCHCLRNFALYILSRISSAVNLQEILCLIRNIFITNTLSGLKVIQL